MAPKFIATNTEDITTKAPPLQALWGLLEKMDPEGELFVADCGIVAVEGQTVTDAPDRSMEALGLTAEERELVKAFAIYDGPEMDVQKTAVGRIYTMYQMLETAFSAGVQWEAARATGA